MRTLKCNTSGILYVASGKYKLARKGMGVKLPSEVQLTDEEYKHPEVQMALQRGWLVEQGDPRTPPQAAPVVSEPEVVKCPHGFVIDETHKCDYCAAEKGEEIPTTPAPETVEKLEQDDISPSEFEKDERRGRKRKQI